MSYGRFAAMIATSVLVMFGLMYLNTYALEHVLWSETRAWMALLMGASMAVIMLGYMLKMYKSPVVNALIFGGAILTFFISLWLVRSQITVNDTEYMEAMIPHHSIAILTSRRAQITNPDVRRLADEIIRAQEREIAEMKYLITHPAPEEGPVLEPLKEEGQPQLRRPGAMLSSAYIPKLDPAGMNPEDIEKALPSASYCSFHYTSGGKPVFAFEAAKDGMPEGVRGVVKLNNSLIALREQSPATEEGAWTFKAEPVVIRLMPASQTVGVQAKEIGEATMTFAVGNKLHVGYSGYYQCTALVAAE